MKLLCKIFGHIVPKYGKQPVYGRVREGGIDGIGRIHADVLVRCNRCDQEFTVIKIHLPKDK